MPYSSLRGNNIAKKNLQRMVECQNIPHALLFSGPAGVGKAQFAQFFAAHCMNTRSGSPDQHTAKIQKGIHPDVHCYFPETAGEMYTIESLRQCLRDIELPPFEAPVQFFIFHEAHQMPPVCSNALLKTLEEPPPETYLLLLTDQPEALLSTIISRCRQVAFFPVADEDISRDLIENCGVSADEAHRIAYLSQGSFAKARGHLDVSRSDLHKGLQELLECDLWKDYTLFLKIATSFDEKISNPREADLVLEELLLAFQQRAFQRGLIFEEIFELFEKARLALQRNVRWRMVLEFLFRGIIPNLK